MDVTDTGITMHCTCDACPVQYEGTVDGYPAYWRARYDTFALAIATAPQTVALDVAVGDSPGWYEVHRYGALGGYDAGFIPLPLAARLMLEGVAAFRLSHPQEGGTA